MKLVQHLYFFGIAVIFAFPILFFNSSWTVVNMLADGSILMLFNIISIVVALEIHVKRFRFQSMSLLMIACVSVLAIFLRIVPMPAGFSLAFLIPICSGIIFGSWFGFLVGQFSMLFGSFIIGGFGPWIASQAFLMGVIAYYSGYFFGPRPKKFGVLIYVSIISILYGYFITVSYWPMVVNDPTFANSVGLRFQSYNQYYVVTSLLWDVTRVIGNLVVFYFLFDSTCEIMERGKKRLAYYV